MGRVDEEAEEDIGGSDVVEGRERWDVGFVDRVRVRVRDGFFVVGAGGRVDDDGSAGAAGAGDG